MDTRLLEKREASVFVEDNDGRNPTWHAARNGNAKSLSVLLEYKCPLRKVAKNGESPLGCAARNGHYDCVKLLLDAGAEMDSYQPQEGGGFTPLCEAAVANRVDIVKLFIERGADVNIGRDRTGYSALSVAAANARDEVIKILAQNGADLNRTGFTNKDKSLPLMRAIEKSHEATATLLIELGADVNASNWDGKTALMKATYRNATGIIRALLEKGANVDAQAIRSRETALMFAAKRGHVEAATLLVKAHANVDLKDDLGRTAWNCARQDGHDRKLDAVLEPVSGKQEVLKRMQHEGDVDEIMMYMNEMF